MFMPIDLIKKKQALYGDRTRGPKIKSLVLCQLS